MLLSTPSPYTRSWFGFPPHPIFNSSLSCSKHFHHPIFTIKALLISLNFLRPLHGLGWQRASYDFRTSPLCFSSGYFHLNFVTSILALTYVIRSSFPFTLKSTSRTLHSLLNTFLTFSFHKLLQVWKTRDFITSGSLHS